MILTSLLVLFYRITSTSISFLDKIPILTREKDARWILACTYSNNSCKSLYGVFEHRWYGKIPYSSIMYSVFVYRRYFNFILLIQKLLILCIYVFARNVPIAIASSMGLVQTAFALMAIKAQPFINRVEVLSSYFTSIHNLF
jgi:hypothetical protein